MGGERCELCGDTGQLWSIETHHIVPQELTSPAGMPDSATVRLCPNCHQEVHTWYAKKVFDQTYDTMNQRFEPKPLVEMAKEYEAAYKVFAEYKKGQPKRA